MYALTFITVILNYSFYFVETLLQFPLCINVKFSLECIILSKKLNNFILHEISKLLSVEDLKHKSM